MKWVVVFIGIDVATGTLRAFSDRTFKSEKARQGLYKKVSEIAISAFSLLLDEFLKENNISLAVSPMTIVYICAMEILSILENFSFNKEIAGLLETLMNFFRKLKGGSEK